MNLLKKPYVLFLLFLVALAVGGGYLAPNDPFETHIDQRLAPPSADYFFGTDELGRCMFSRLICSVRVSLGLSAAILVICLVTGGCIGMVSGYFGGLIDEILMRVTDTIMAMPSFIVAMVLIGKM